MLIGAMTLALGGCTRLPPMRVGDPGTSRTIDVLTFSIEGLGWTARRGRAGQRS